VIEASTDYSVPPLVKPARRILEEKGLNGHDIYYDEFEG
jgi:hypothetical protein